MRAIGWIIAVLMVLVAGCVQVDENPKFNPPEELPAWAYDAPFYYEPPEDLPALETIGDGIGVYYTNDQSFFIRHPGGCQLGGVPRVGVYYSMDMGGTWNKAGYYGVEQTHFNFLAKHEGKYWIRFVGPGQGIVDCPPGVPHRIYVADRSSPTIVLTVLPSPWDDEEKGIPHIYKAGQNVRLSWGVSDANLDPNSIRMGICFAEFPFNVVWSALPEPLEEADSITVELPPEAAHHGGIRFRLAARDKCGNIGMSMTDVLHVQAAEPVPPMPPSTQPAMMPAMPAPSPAPPPTVAPVPPPSTQPTVRVELPPPTSPAAPPAVAPAPPPIVMPAPPPPSTQPAVAPPAPVTQPTIRPVLPPPSTQPSVRLPLPPPPPEAGRQAALAPVPAESEREERPGWPKINQRLQPGTRRELRWLPPGAHNYPVLELQFSSNDGLMWQTVATGLRPGRPVVWTVPNVASKACRLRILAITHAPNGTDRVESTLAMTQRFNVNGENATAYLRH